MRLASKKWLKRANVYWMIYSGNQDEAHKYYLKFKKHQRDMDRAIVVASEASKILADKEYAKRMGEFVNSKMAELEKVGKPNEQL